MQIKVFMQLEEVNLLASQQLKGSVEKGDNRFRWSQKVKGQQNIFIIKQIFKAEV